MYGPVRSLIVRLMFKCTRYVGQIYAARPVLLVRSDPRVNFLGGFGVNFAGYILNNMKVSMISVYITFSEF